MPTSDSHNDKAEQRGLFMDEQKIMLKLADVLFEEHLITTNEKLELMKLIHKGW